MSEIQIKLLSEKCKDCPRLSLMSAEYMGKKEHRCMNLQLCREVLAFWKINNSINELEITQYGDVCADNEEYLPLFGDKE